MKFVVCGSKWPAEWKDSGGNYGVLFYEVRGCGHEQLYECSNKPRCSERNYPAGMKPSW